MVLRQRKQLVPGRLLPHFRSADVEPGTASSGRSNRFFPPPFPLISSRSGTLCCVALFVRVPATSHPPLAAAAACLQSVTLPRIVTGYRQQRRSQFPCLPSVKSHAHRPHPWRIHTGLPAPCSSKAVSRWCMPTVLASRLKAKKKKKRGEFF